MPCQVQEHILQGGTVHLQVADLRGAGGEFGDDGDGHVAAGRQRDPDDLRFGGAGGFGAGAEQFTCGPSVLGSGTVRSRWSPPIFAFSSGGLPVVITRPRSSTAI